MIMGCKHFPGEPKDKNIEAILVPLTMDANEKSFVKWHLNASPRSHNDVTCAIKEYLCHEDDLQEA